MYERIIRTCLILVISDFPMNGLLSIISLMFNLESTIYVWDYAHQSHASNGCCLCSYAQLGRKTGRTGEDSRFSRFTKSILLKYISK